MFTEVKQYVVTFSFMGIRIWLRIRNRYKRIWVQQFQRVLDPDPTAQKSAFCKNKLKFTLILVKSVVIDICYYFPLYT
jgi:hypothetical protein